MEVAKLVPELHPRPWGRRDLSPLYPMPAGRREPIGEAWLSSLTCRVELPGSGQAEKNLGQLWGEMTPAERGPALVRLERFPLLVKFIFTSEKLSIQVHPDDSYARPNENEPWGKTEMWHVLAAEPGAWVGIGFKPEIADDQVAAVFGKPEIEGALNRLPAQRGDTFYVPAGTVHSIGPGLCLCEIQQYSDVTYRMYDYDRLGLDGRQRALHLEQARAVTRVETPEAGRARPTPLGGEEPKGDVLLASPYFVTEKYGVCARLELTMDPTHFDLLVFCAGTGTLISPSERLDYGRGDAFLVMASTDRVEVEPREPSELLRIYVPHSHRFLPA